MSFCLTLGLGCVILGARAQESLTRAAEELHPLVKAGFQVYTNLHDALQRPERVIVLDLSRQGLEHLPASLATLTNLEMLVLSHNKLSSLPESLSRLPLPGGIALQGNPFPAHERERIKALLSHTTTHF